MNSRELHNLDVIDSLNQRGGRMLSVIDLLAAGSLSLPMAAYLLRRVQAGASFMTAARPGGAGKTAVMGALLGLVPPGAALNVVTAGRDAYVTEAQTPTWHVCHELGAGHWYGYLWRGEVREYFDAIGPGNYVATNMHADTLPEIEQILAAPPLSVPPQLLARLDLIITLRVDHQGGRRRHRLAEVYASEGTKHRRIYQWDRSSDSFEASAAAPEEADLAPEIAFLEKLTGQGICKLPDFRQRLLSFYSPDANPSASRL